MYFIFIFATNICEREWCEKHIIVLHRKGLPNKAIKKKTRQTYEFNAIETMKNEINENLSMVIFGFSFSISEKPILTLINIWMNCGAIKCGGKFGDYANVNFCGLLPPSVKRC